MRNFFNIRIKYFPTKHACSPLKGCGEGGHPTVVFPKVCVLRPTALLKKGSGTGIFL